MKRKTESRKRKGERGISPWASPRALPRGISLLEVLISMFVLLFGLMGVAAVFPVGSHYVVEGDKYNKGALSASNAFEEFKIRGMLKPKAWLYGDSTAGSLYWLIKQSIPNVDEFAFPLLPPPPFDVPHPGHAFVIDPLGAADAIGLGIPSADVFPNYDLANDQVNEPNPWVAASTPLMGERWPVRRLTLPTPDPSSTNSIPMPYAVAEMIFRLRDDLTVELPDAEDRPSVQRFMVDNNGTLEKEFDDILLARDYTGSYSWLATIVPDSQAKLAALQPSDSGHTSYNYDVSVVTLYKRDTTPSAASERLVTAQLLPGGELILFDDVNNDPTVVDAAFQEIRPGNWIAVMGVHPTTGVFLMKWFRLLSLDDENQTDDIVLDDGTTFTNHYLRRAMLDGPDWPAPGGVSSIDYLKVAILPGVINVVTKQMPLE